MQHESDYDYFFIFFTLDELWIYYLKSQVIFKIPRIFFFIKNVLHKWATFVHVPLKQKKNILKSRPIIKLLLSWLCECTVRCSMFLMVGTAHTCIPALGGEIGSLNSLIAENLFRLLVFQWCLKSLLIVQFPSFFYLESTSLVHEQGDSLDQGTKSVSSGTHRAAKDAWYWKRCGLWQIL